jgi:hypothetical protein
VRVCVVLARAARETATSQRARYRGPSERDEIWGVSFFTHSLRPDFLEQAGTWVDLSTVYRNLTSLVELGAQHALTVADRTATFGRARAPHHHAVCTPCGAVIEISAEQLARLLREATLFNAADQTVLN